MQKQEKDNIVVREFPDLTYVAMWLAIGAIGVAIALSPVTDNGPTDVRAEIYNECMRRHDLNVDLQQVKICNELITSLKDSAEVKVK